MKRDWVVIGSAILLFLSGFLWAQFLPDSEFWKSKLDIDANKIFTAASAIATAIAAIAAWKSASISSVSATDSRAFSRMQAYILHKQQFDTLLVDIEKELEVTFRERNGLYNDIFPDNRHVDRPLNTKAHGPAFFQWIETFNELLQLTHKYPPMAGHEIKIWMVEQVVLSDDCLRFRFSTEDQTFRVSTIDTKVSLEDPLYCLGLTNSVLNHFYVFGMIDDWLGMPNCPPWFEEALRQFRLDIYLGNTGCDYW